MTLQHDKRIVELDGIRGLAVLMVLFWHYFGSVPKEFSPDSIVSYLVIASRLLWSGVDLFFVLSGFLICGIILDHHQDACFLKTFFIRRAARILPVYILTLFIYLVLKTTLNPVAYGWLFSNPISFWTYPVFMQNVAMGVAESYGSNFLAISWSLAVEEQFYLVAPLSILAIGRRRWVNSMMPLMAVAVVLRIALPIFASYLNTAFRMDSLLIGGVIAAVIRNEEAYSFLFRHRDSVLWTLAVGVLMLGVISVRLGIGTLIYTIVSAVFATLLLTAILYRGTPLTSILRINALRFFGTIAYGLYMFHQAVNGLCHGAITGSSPSLVTTAGVQATLLALVITIVLSAASLRFMERPIWRVGQSYSYASGKQ